MRSIVVVLMSQIFNCALRKPTSTKINIVYIENPIEADMPGHWLPADIVKKILEIQSNYTTTPRVKFKHSYKLNPKKLKFKNSFINVMENSAKPRTTTRKSFQSTNRPIAHTKNPTTAINKDPSFDINKNRATTSPRIIKSESTKPYKYSNHKNNVHEDDQNNYKEKPNIKVVEYTNAASIHSFKTKSVTSDINNINGYAMKPSSVVKKTEDAETTIGKVVDTKGTKLPSTTQFKSTTQLTSTTTQTLMSLILTQFLSTAQTTIASIIEPPPTTKPPTTTETTSASKIVSATTSHLISIEGGTLKEPPTTKSVVFSVKTKTTTATDTTATDTGDPFY